MKINRWVCSADDRASVEVEDLGNILPAEEKELEILLSILWDQKSDSFHFKVRINLYTEEEVQNRYFL